MIDTLNAAATVAAAAPVGTRGATSLDTAFAILSQMDNIIKGSQRSLAMQWFIANSFFLLTAAAFGLLIYLMRRPIKGEGEEDAPAKSVSTKKFAIITGVFVIGLVAAQVLLQLIGVLAWCALFGAGITVYLKGRSPWFTRRDHAIPKGWIVIAFSALAIMILIFNTFPAIAGR